MDDESVRAYFSDESNRNQQTTEPNHDKSTSICIVDLTWIIWILFNHLQGLSGFIRIIQELNLVPLYKVSATLQLTSFIVVYHKF